MASMAHPHLGAPAQRSTNPGPCDPRFLRTALCCAVTLLRGGSDRSGHSPARRSAARWRGARYPHALILAGAVPRRALKGPCSVFRCRSFVAAPVRHALRCRTLATCAVSSLTPQVGRTLRISCGAPSLAPAPSAASACSTTPLIHCAQPISGTDRCASSRRPSLVRVCPLQRRTRPQGIGNPGLDLRTPGTSA